MKALYIFVTSDRPDQYLNPIACCLQGGIKRVVFVEIHDSISSQTKASAVCRDVYDLTYQLAQGKYKYYVGDKKGQEVPLDQKYPDKDKLKEIQKKYSSYLVGSVTWDHEDIKYANLKRYIYTLSKQKEDSIIDISCVSKAYIGDILSCCLLNDFKNLYVFDLIVEPDFSQPWKTLIHDLKKDSDFQYANIFEKNVFQDNLKSLLIRTTPFITSIAATSIFVILALIANFALGNNNTIIQILSIVNTVFGVIAFVLTFFPLRGT